MSFTYTDLSAVFIHDIYLDFVEKGYMQYWTADAVTTVNSTNYGQIYSIATGQTGGLQAFTPGTPTGNDKVAAYKTTLIPDIYEDHFFVDKASLDGDVSGVFNARASAMAKSVLTSKQNIFLELLQSNPTDWTNNDYFGNHQYASYASQTNSISSSQVASLDVVDPAAPTPIEMDAILFDVATYGQSFRGESNLVISGDATKWTILCGSPAVYGAAKRAVTNQLLSVSGVGQVDSTTYALSHDNSGLWSWNPVYVPNLYVSPGAFGANDIVFLRNDDTIKPFILGEDPDEPEFLGLGSEYAIENYGVKYSMKKRMIFAPGHWHAGIKATLS